MAAELIVQQLLKTHKIQKVHRPGSLTLWRCTFYVALYYLQALIPLPPQLFPETECLYPVRAQSG